MAVMQRMSDNRKSNEEKLTAPSISISESILTIDNIDNKGQSIDIYIDGNLATNIPASVEQLSFISNEDGTCYVSGIGNVTGNDITISYYSPSGDVVTSIGSLSFYNRTNIESITIPQSVESIRGAAFYNCSSLESITYQDTKENWNLVTKGINWDYNTNIIVIHCTDGDIYIRQNRAIMDRNGNAIKDSDGNQIFAHNG